ncbi:hypothetical protein GOP47_0025409 [Adiantum capillus-veneris]|uniref:Small-subunit processome Utp12 domain-containing protein n=1 Tax=Adiantum capillus-veneris TaxID=13818 RepID=A0A9D4U0K6_ADICA|nr:hypothetical protein GOP47_0025409 [Adiantum capillus-veneris]
MPSSVLKNLLTAFSPRGDYLAICSGDGRVKTWDTVNGFIKGDFADLPSGTDAMRGDGHLAVEYTCMAWNPAIKKGKKKHGSAFLIGLGTGSGDVIILDAALGKLKWKVEDCHSGGVKSVAFTKSGSILYSSGVDGMVCQFDVDSGQLQGKFKASKRAVSYIAVSGDGKYLVAGSGDIRLFDLSTRKRLCKYPGHPDAVKALVYTGDDCYFLSSAVGERLITMWHNDGSNKGATALGSFSMEHPAVSIDCSGELPGILRVLAVSEAGVAHIWQAENVEELSNVKPIKIAIAKSKGETSPASKVSKSFKPAIFAATFSGKSVKGAGSVLVAFGTTVKPSFERIALEGKGDKIFLKANENGALMPQLQSGEATANKGPLEAVILGPDNAVDAEKPKSHVELNEAAIKPSKRKKRPATEESQNVISDGLKQHGTEIMHLDGESQDAIDDGEETMEEKLKALGIMPDEGEEEEEKQGSVAPLKADSLQVLMTQALESYDKALLKQCLSVTDNKIIVKTVQMLNPSVAAKFLQMSVDNLDLRTGRALVLVPWIKAVLLYHASYIMSSPSIQPILSSLYQVIDSRLTVFRPLLSLSGRLDLIMAQVARAETTQQQEVAAAVVYEESDDEGEVEDVMNTDSAEDASDDSEEDSPKSWPCSSSTPIR